MDDYEPLDGHNGNTPRSETKAKSRKRNVLTNDETTKLVVDDVIDHTGFGLFQVFVMVLAGILWLSDGLEVLLVSVLGPVLLCEWQLNPWQEAFITTCAFAGYLVGSPLFGMLSDVFGRKTSLCIGAVWVLFYGVLSGFAPNIVWLLILRFLVGIGVGAVPQAVTYYAEFSPTKHRGKAIVLIEVFFALGGSLAALLALLTLELYGWRVWLIACALPSITFVIFVYWLPESPRFHLVTGQPRKAWRTLELAARLNKSSLPEGKLHAKVEERRGRIVDLVKPGYKKVSVLLGFLWFCSVFVYVGVILLATEFIEIGTTCPSGRRILKAAEVAGGDCKLDCNSLTFSDLQQIFLASLGELPGLVITAFLVDVVGRKVTFAINFGVVALVCGLLLICLERTFMLIVIIVGRAMSASLLQVAYLYTPEAYPTAVRSVALGMGSALGRVGAMITPYVAQVILKYSIVMCLCIYGVLSVLGMICALLLPVETKGKTLKS